MIVNRIYEWARSQPTKAALIHNDASVSYAEFARAIEASRSFFKSQNLPAGSTALVLVHSLDDAWVFTLALRALGLNTSCVRSIAEAEAIKFKDVSCIVVKEGKRESQQLHGNPPAGAKVIAVPAAIFSNIRIGDLPIAPRDGNLFGGHILFTSGTTGSYKKVLQEGAVEEKRNIVRARQSFFGRDTVAHFGNFMLSTGGGFKNPSAVWQVGGCVVIDQRPNLFAHYFNHDITNAFVVPSMLNALLQKYDTALRFQTDQIEFDVIGGFTPLKLAERVVCDLNARLSLRYSATETGGLMMCTQFKTKDDLYWYAPVNNRTIQVVDELGNECPTGQTGYLRVLTTEIDCSSYLDDEKASAKVFRDGFFYPGDMAVKRADGRVRVLGRTEDVVNFQGQKLAVAPIEQEIQNALQADEVCIFSGLDDQGNEELVIAIQSNREFQQSELKAVAGRFVSFERVRFAILPDFPRADSAMNKVQRSLLRKLVSTGTGRHS